MKKSLVIVFLMILAILVLSVNVFATAPQVAFEGDKTVEPGETKEVSVLVSADVAVGVVSGKVEKSSEISNITVKALNDWNLTYNANTGVFNIYKAEGSTSEAIMKITYTASTNEGTGTITLSDLQVTTLDYETEELNDVVKSITIKASEPEEPGTEEPGTEEPGTEEPGTGEPNTDKPTTDKPETNTPAKDNTIADKTMNKAGLEDYLFVIIACLVVVSSISYAGYKKYKNI